MPDHKKFRHFYQTSECHQIEDFFGPNFKKLPTFKVFIKIHFFKIIFHNFANISQVQQNFTISTKFHNFNQMYDNTDNANNAYNAEYTDNAYITDNADNTDNTENTDNTDNIDNEDFLGNRDFN